MHLVIDKNLPFGTEAFGTVGEVTAVPTQGISADVVRDADVLVIRSETKVVPSLLEGSRIKFVGTATIGTDHVDLEYLRKRSIGFTNAPGCNANSVVEYVAAALLALGAQKGITLRGKTLGIVGVGAIGSRVERLARVLGMDVLLNDPPLANATGEARYVSLETALQADIVTLHVPLTKTGPDRTYHLLDGSRIASLKQGTLVINASRGGVIETGALIEGLRSGRVGGAVLDVWEGEPHINTGLRELVTLGTPHIAGYSLDGKVNAVRIVYDALCRFLGQAGTWKPPFDRLPQPAVPVISLSSGTSGTEQIIRDVICRCYDIELDDANLRKVIQLPPSEQGPAFMRLRSGYRVRREFAATRIDTPDPALRQVFAGLGFS